MRLRDKTALVTGAGRGIGRAVALAFAREGCDLLLTARTAGELEETASLARAEGRRAETLTADLANPEAVACLADAALRLFGGVDILVNNAGIQHVAPIDEFPPEKWDAIIAINLSSAFHAIRAVLPGMKSRQWGRIINIASAHGLVASPLKSAYVAAKHGMIGLTKVVALEVAQLGITCNAICPGYVKTPLVEGQIADQAKARKMDPDAVVRDVILAAQPTKKFVTFEELNALALFLADDKAASINGASLSMDGGWTAQ
jgi:3-hydroxybutyrate dehydrogenase